MVAKAHIQQNFNVPAIGLRIKALRKQKSLTLSDLAARTEISEATLSRIENGSTDIAAHKLYQLAQELGVDITAFFGNETVQLAPGVRSVSRRGEGENYKSARFSSVVLCPDISKKQMQPFINTITVQSLESAGGLESHDGEEFLLVLEGNLVLHSQHYAPLLLQHGDSVYFDGSAAHAYVSAGDQPAKILVMTSTKSIASSRV